jgi:nucleoid-associated protein YgaU
MTSEDQKKTGLTGVPSGSSSTAPHGSSAPETEMAYRVAEGDSLAKIAQKIYGDAGKWHLIFQANADQIQNPDLIHPGQILKIPAA